MINKTHGTLAVMVIFFKAPLIHSETPALPCYLWFLSVTPQIFPSISLLFHGLFLLPSPPLKALLTLQDSSMPPPL